MEAVSTLDPFAAALQKVKELHQRQVEYFTKELEIKNEENHQQRDRISHLEMSLNHMKSTLAACKVKITHQKKVISQLQTSAETSLDPQPSPDLQANAAPQLLIPSSYINALVTPYSTGVRGQTDGCKTANKTCMSLFSDSPSILCTPSSTAKLSTSASPEQRTQTALEDTAIKNSESGPGVTDVDETRFYLSRTFNKHKQPQRNDQAPLPPPEFLSDCEYSNSNASTCTTSSRSVAMESDGDDIALEDQVANNRDVADAKTSSNSGHRLSLKLSRKLRYKEHRSDKNRSNDTSNASKESPLLSESPQSDCPPSVGSSHCSDQTSPSLLRHTTSPWKQSHTPPSSFLSPSPASHHGNVSQSLFVNTPGILSEEESCSIMSTPLSTGGLQIPHTDSQLSLDISDTIPPSPELCYGSEEEVSPQQVVVKGTDYGELPCKVMETSEHHQQTTRSSEQQKSEKTKHTLIQSTFTPIDCDEKIPVKSSDAGHPEKRMLVLATPGVRPVDRMLSRECSWMYHNRGLVAASARTQQKRALNDGTSDDGESVLPQKKAHLDCESSDDISFLNREPVQVEWSLDATRLGGVNDETFLSNEPKTNEGVGLLKSTRKCDDIQTDNQLAGNVLRKDDPVKYKYIVPIRNRATRAKLDAKACPDCNDWYLEDDGIHGNRREHLKATCRHKHLHLPPDSDPKIWDIGFPATEETD